MRVGVWQSEGRGGIGRGYWDGVLGWTGLEKERLDRTDETMDREVGKSITLPSMYVEMYLPMAVNV